MLEAFNQDVFLSINAGPTSSAAARLLGVAAADWLFWLIPTAFVVGWIFGGVRLRQALLIASMAAVAGLILNQTIGWAWPRPRPFMMGLGRQLIAHQPDPTFPSDHLTVVWAVAFCLLGSSGAARSLGVIAAFLGAAIAWGRIYVGVHFPLDMLGSAAVGMLASVLAHAFGFRVSVKMLRLGLRVGQWGMGFGRLKSGKRSGRTLLRDCSADKPKVSC